MRPVARRGASIAVEAGRNRSYSVLLEEGSRLRLGELLSERVPAHRYALISDERVAALYAAEILDSIRAEGLRAELFTFPEGERHKTRKQWSILSDALLRAGFGRDSAVVSIGGGVTGDLAGFVAATFLRGVPVVHLPTTLVAMLDSSVGGKTGVNTGIGKNLIGAFHPPALVVVDPAFSRTLSRGQRAEGLAEAIKHGAILDASYYAWVAAAADALLAGEPGATLEAAVRSLRIKAGVVGQDEMESGYREVLNFGHTIGHALEAAAEYALAHGAAIMRGMRAEAALGERLGVTREGTAESLREMAGMLEMPGVSGWGASPGRVLGRIASDKKSRRGRPRFVLLGDIGTVARGPEGWSHEVPLKTVRKVLEASLL